MRRQEGPIAITGATGFIGRRLLAQLARSGFRVRALVRQGSEHKLPERPFPFEVVTGDLEDQNVLEQLVEGCAAVVHCAALIKAPQAEDFFRVNVEGTRNLVAVLPKEARLVHISSLAARCPKLSPYAASKRAGEEVVQSFSGSKIILRPPAVYGPGDRELRPLLEGLRHGLLLRLGPKEARFSLLHVDDLITAVELALKKREVQGLFELSDGEVYSWDRVADIGRQVFQREILTLSVPAPLLFGVAHVTERIGRLLRRPLTLTPAKVRELRYPDWVCENKAIRQQLGFRPAIQLEEGLRRLYGGLSGDPQPSHREGF